MLSETQKAAIGLVLVVGYGYMGKTYVKFLRGLGFSDDDLVVVDLDPVRATEYNTTYPTSPSANVCLDAALARQPRTAFVLVNTPAHKTVIKACLDVGVQNIFVEKPLVMPRQLDELLISPGIAKVNLCVGHVINFSRVLLPLLRLMRKKNLVLVQGISAWGKDRTADTRPTPGDLDEIPHPLALFLSLCRINQSIDGDVRVQAALSRLPFANEEAQRLACNRDASFPECPPSSSVLALQVPTDKSLNVLLGLTSSFVGFQQQRWVEMAFACLDGESLSYLARIDFDLPEKMDRLVIRSLVDRAEMTYDFPSDTKLGDSVETFLTWVAGSECDPRIVRFQEAVQLVRITALAEASAYRFDED